MPSSLKNHRKKPFTSDPFETAPLSSIAPLTEDLEAVLIESLLVEINDIFGLDLNTTPDTSRNPDPIPEHDNARTVLIGASHMCRVATAMREEGLEVTDLCSPGWTPSKENLKKAESYLLEFRPEAQDRVIMDLWSNSAFMGTDESGFPCRPQRDPTDHKYHVFGQLQAAPQTLFQTIMRDASGLIGAAGSATVVLVTPIPRYVTNRCCREAEHITNWGTDEFRAELARASEAVEMAASVAGPPELIYRIFNPMDIWNGTDSNTPEAATSDGSPVWLDYDPVHLTSAAYLDIARSLIGMEDDSELRRPTKRLRLESLVPAPPVMRGCGRGSVKPPLWVAGVANAPQAGGRGWGRGRGMGGWRASPRFIRGRGGRGPYRGPRRY